jgi:8-oxo-dGTP diphosphatase
VELLEHKSARWLRRDELNEVEWLPADVAVVDKIEQKIK